MANCRSRSRRARRPQRQAVAQTTWNSKENRRRPTGQAEGQRGRGRQVSRPARTVSENGRSARGVIDGGRTVDGAPETFAPRQAGERYRPGLVLDEADATPALLLLRNGTGRRLRRCFLPGRTKRTGAGLGRRRFVVGGGRQFGCGPVVAGRTSRSASQQDVIAATCLSQGRREQPPEQETNPCGGRTKPVARDKPPHGIFRSGSSAVGRVTLRNSPDGIVTRCPLQAKRTRFDEFQQARPAVRGTKSTSRPGGREGSRTRRPAR
jgi:hypothetical protein